MKEKSDVGKMVGRRDTIVKVRTETMEVAEERERREVKEGGASTTRGLSTHLQVHHRHAESRGHIDWVTLATLHTV